MSDAKFCSDLMKAKVDFNEIWKVIENLFVKFSPVFSSVSIKIDPLIGNKPVL